jgi:hypothetical protein
MKSYGKKVLLLQQKGFLITPDEKIRIREIGRGLFSRAYIEEFPATESPRVFLRTDSDADDKELLVAAKRRHPRNPHLPSTKFVGYGEDSRFYVMPYYNAPLRKSASPVAWEQYQIMKACFKERSPWAHPPEPIMSLKDAFSRPPGPDGIEINEKVYKCAKKNRLAAPVLEALGALIDAARDIAPDYTLEFYPRNLATDDEGNIVLLDVMFNPANVATRWEDSLLHARGELFSLTARFSMSVAGKAGRSNR